MKKALSYKILMLLTTLALSLALAFSFYGAKSAHAADVNGGNVLSYFTGDFQSLELNDDSLVAKVKNGGNIKIKNELVVDDLAIELNVPNTVSSFKIVLTYSSYSAIGAYNEETEEFDKTITNEFTFNKTGDLTAAITTSDNVVSVDVDGETKAKAEFVDKIKGTDKCVATVGFEFTLEDGAEDAEISFTSIDQKASDISGAYKQTFVLDADNKIETFAKPRVSVNNLETVKNDDKLKAVEGQKYSFTFTAYSVFGNVLSSSVYIDKTSIGAGLSTDEKSETPKFIVCGNTSADATFTLRTSDIADIEEYTVEKAVELNDYETVNTAPSYIPYVGNEEAYENYRLAVQNAAKKDYGEYGVKSIRLGDSYEIPSLQDLVLDDYDVYSNLTYTVYYRTPSNASGSASSLKFTVSEAGDYEFYVAFKDKSNKAMEKSDFYTLDEHDNQVIAETGTYFAAVFNFTVEDDAPISVEAPASQGSGYVNTKYTATSFTIQSSGNNVKYTLYYNAKNNAQADDTGWVEIPVLADITADYSENGFTYADIEKIGYDGEYTFTPTLKGSYKITCNVTSVNQERSASADTIIKVLDEPAVVKVDDHWFQKNVWSVVFLSIGTLSLIGIIVLLFIKPKEETETDETGDALNVNAKK